MNNILNCNLTKNQIALAIKLIEDGVNPSALAAGMNQLLSQIEDAESSHDQMRN